MLVALIFSLLLFLGNSSNPGLPQVYTIEVVNEYPHDPGAFTRLVVLVKPSFCLVEALIQAIVYIKYSTIWSEWHCAIFSGYLI